MKIGSLASIGLVVPVGAKTITYIYDASGTKLERITKQGTTTLDDRSYDNGIEYSGSNIDLVHTVEGRALPSSGGYIFQYQVADHLGNIRAVFGDANNDGVLSTSEIVQASDYYAFGREITSLNAATPQRYKYNGKELQDDFNQYDYGARFYDPIINRWNVVDPLTEINRRWSPYTYVSDNPVRMIDPDGMYGVDFSDGYSTYSTATYPGSVSLSGSYETTGSGSPSTGGAASNGTSSNNGHTSSPTNSIVSRTFHGDNYTVDGNGNKILSTESSYEETVNAVLEDINQQGAHIPLVNPVSLISDLS